MLMAFLKGKLSSNQANMEDLLTSNVFGMLKYMDPASALFPFLSKSADADGNHLRLDGLNPAARIDYEFWPLFDKEGAKRCEPDLVIRLSETGGEDIIILVEAKYLSGKSSEADAEDERPNDQLAREWDNLTRIAKETGAKPVLIYLTAGFGFPVDDIEASQKELGYRHQTETNIYWLSWRHLHSLIIKKQVKAAGIMEEEMLADVARLLGRMQLTFFNGFTVLKPPEPFTWTFRRAFNWKVEQTKPIDWRFKDG